MEEVVPTKAAPHHGDEGHFAHWTPSVGQMLKHKKDHCLLPNRIVEALSRDADNAAIWGGR